MFFGLIALIQISWFKFWQRIVTSSSFDENRICYTIYPISNKSTKLQQVTSCFPLFLWHGLVCIWNSFWLTESLPNIYKIIQSFATWGCLHIVLVARWLLLAAISFMIMFTPVLCVLFMIIYTPVLRVHRQSYSGTASHPWSVQPAQSKT